MEILQKTEKGFTLIEVLMVVAIIGILATIVLVSLNTARSKARDVRRISDLRQLALALEMSYDDNSTYPVQATCVDIATPLAALATGGYMGALPADPGTYTYSYLGICDRVCFESSVREYCSCRKLYWYRLCL